MWDKLSMRDRFDLMKIFISSGVKDLGTMRKFYNEFKEGGDTKQKPPSLEEMRQDYVASQDNTKVVIPTIKKPLSFKEKIYKSVIPSDDEGMAGAINAFGSAVNYISGRGRKTYLDKPETWDKREIKFDEEDLKNFPELLVKEVGKSEDAFKKYLGLPMSDENTFVESQHKPSKEKKGNTVYYRFNDEDIRKNVNDRVIEMFNNRSWNDEFLLQTEGKFSSDYPSFTLGNSTLGIAPDSSYVSIYDKYNFLKWPFRKLEDKVANTWEYYDRIPINKDSLKINGRYIKND